MAFSFHRSLFIPRLGPSTLPSPGLGREWGGGHASWVSDDERILLDDTVRASTNAPLPIEWVSVEKAGPRKSIFFDPAHTTFAVVTCGGLCPGINDVIRSIVMHGYYGYGIRRILGLRYGYEALNSRFGHSPIELTPERVAKIQHLGGSVLGTSRGPQPPSEMVDRLEALGVQALFVVGGDGSQRGARDLYEEIAILAE
jgi:6-phosphofructokinase 1